ncbi:hypothetical protein [Psychromonas arctica]|uniref:hypothetical protein n=1 Tax=Psychromonas arctica TaxID=168275 RepID=UPI002FD64EBE
MADLPQIEWQEQSNSDDNLKTKESIIELLKLHVKYKLIENEYFYFIAPDPARNVLLLTKKIEALALLNINTNGIKIVNYGHKNRGWGVIFQEAELLESLIPLFFEHGPEHLAITAIKNSLLDNHKKLPLILSSIIFGGNNTVAKNEYAGLYFECDRLTELL